MVIDEIRVILEAGNGGDGIASFFPGRNSGPDGGKGGRGGDIIAIVNRKLSDLSRYGGKRKLKAEDGGKGGNFEKVGKHGDQFFLEVPVGTSVCEIGKPDSEEIQITNEPILLCHGGFGGRGNASFKSSTNRVPRKAELGKPGEEKEFRVIMRYIADFGFVGLPNAGKSSLLNALTAAKVKTAAYPFTTVHANLGSCEGKTLADIPGLIEGASEGKGLGFRFLKHIEKVHTIFHCISVESLNPLHDYEVIRKELGTFRTSLLEKKEIILLTKVDLVDQKKVEEMKELLKSKNSEIYPVTILRSDLVETIRALIIEP